MLVRMKTNLGWIDAQEIGVSPGECMEGMTPEVSDSAGQWLVSHKKSEELPAIRGVPPASIQAVPPAAMQPKPAHAGRGKQSDKSTPDKES